MSPHTTGPEIRVGQQWTDLDERNAQLYTRGPKKGQVKARRVVEIVKLPTLSRKGVMRVVTAPQNPKSEGQLREFTRGKLTYYYTLTKEA